MADDPKSKVLTFESWVTKADWFQYAVSNPDEVPYLLCDRSPCQDPFFDLFAAAPGERRPMISGLCRCTKNFNIGDRYVYVTKLCPDAGKRLNVDLRHGSRYLGVASMVVVEVAPSHEDASREFQPRRYVAAPFETPYPPGLAHDERPIAAASHGSCIVHRDSKSCGSSKRQVALTPDESTPQDWRNEYSAYHKRMSDCCLRVAFCRFEMISGHEALATKLENAPVLSQADWEDRRLNFNGRLIGEKTGQSLARLIAERGCLV